ncbi:MAG: hypothetical protein CR984_05810 [Proteobacteria bacterium]|nr:MAG: hypothetical protein CR984_05810 [Pseudomonadota bacterium]
MYIDRKKQGAVCGKIVNDRRSGLDRRQVSYDWYIPERRITVDRRFSIPSSENDHTAWNCRQRYA